MRSGLAWLSSSERKSCRGPYTVALHTHFPSFLMAGPRPRMPDLTVVGCIFCLTPIDTSLVRCGDSTLLVRLPLPYTPMLFCDQSLSMLLYFWEPLLFCLSGSLMRRRMRVQVSDVAIVDLSWMETHIQYTVQWMGWNSSSHVQQDLQCSIYLVARHAQKTETVLQGRSTTR